MTEVEQVGRTTQLQATEHLAACGAVAGVGLQQLETVMAAAAAQLPSQGWPVPSAKALKRCVSQASRAATYPDFALLELIKYGKLSAAGEQGWCMHHKA